MLAKKVFLSLAVLIIVKTTVYSQAALFVLIFGDKVATEKFHLSLDIGANVASMNGYEAGDVNTGINFGLGAHLMLNDRWFLAPEFKALSRKGVKNVDVPFPIPSEFDVSESTSDIILNYIEVPILLQYRTPGRWYFSGGPQIGFLNTAKQESEIILATGTEVNVTQNLKSQFENMEFSFPLEVGYSISKLRGGKGMDIRARYTYGLSEIFKSETSFSANNSTFQFILTFPFILIDEE